MEFYYLKGLVFLKFNKMKQTEGAMCNHDMYVLSEKIACAVMHLDSSVKQAYCNK